MIACLADDLAINPPVSVSDVAQRWIDRFWIDYSSNSEVQLAASLNTKQPYNPAAQAPEEGTRTIDEEGLYNSLKRSFFVGFCIAGYVNKDRELEAAYMSFEPAGPKPSFTLVNQETRMWWGVPNIINRLVYGADDNLFGAILASGKWAGTPQDLLEIIRAQALMHGSLPLRDAIDYVYSSIHCTIKAMKFSSMSQICGGPIEIAVISSDRKFRWVRHKPWDAAITDGGL
jgi:hypothetical protein